MKSGDGLYAIAQKYGVSVDDLISYNNLSTTNLNAGQQLLVPKQKESKYITYKVKEGDSLYSIANAYSTTVNQLKNINNLSSNLLSVGQTLLIPTEVSAPLIPSTPSNTTITYIVKSGDNLYTLARLYNTTIDELKRINNLTTNQLSIGQRLLIPNTSESTIYTVKSGDNLYSIARKYNTTVTEIKKRNNLTSNLLSIGQKLVI